MKYLLNAQYSKGYTRHGLYKYKLYLVLALGGAQSLSGQVYIIVIGVHKKCYKM